MKIVWTIGILLFAHLVFAQDAPPAGDDAGTGDETPGDETPGDPGDETPGDETPGDPGDETPGDETPGDETPGDETPGDETPGDETPGDETPGDETPEDETPVDETPGDETPGDETPGDETPGDETPGDETPGDETPGDETPEDETPGDETPGEETPGDETPGDETPGDETPEDESPGDETPEDETPGDETPGDETPGDETPGDEGTNEDGDGGDTTDIEAVIGSANSSSWGISEQCSTLLASCSSNAETLESEFKFCEAFDVVRNCTESSSSDGEECTQDELDRIGVLMCGLDRLFEDDERSAVSFACTAQVTNCLGNTDGVADVASLADFKTFYCEASDATKQCFTIGDEGVVCTQDESDKISDFLECSSCGLVSSFFLVTLMLLLHKMMANFITSSQ